MRKSVLVTGSAKRIGRRLALDLAKDGWDVAVHCNASLAEAEEVASFIRNIGQRAVIVRGDLSDVDVPDRLVAEASAGLGGLTSLINNASLFEPDEVGSISKASWAAHLDTNLRAPVFLSQAFARQLPEGEEGNIISIIDQRVWKLNPKFFSYTTSKSGLWTATRTLAQALAPRIRVNAVGPGPTLANVHDGDAGMAQEVAGVPLQHAVSPGEIADAVLYLAQARSVTGQTLCVDAGQSIGWKTPDIVG